MPPNEKPVSLEELQPGTKISVHKKSEFSALGQVVDASEQRVRIQHVFYGGANLTKDVTVDQITRREGDEIRFVLEL